MVFIKLCKDCGIELNTENGLLSRGNLRTRCRVCFNNKYRAYKAIKNQEHINRNKEAHLASKRLYMQQYRKQDIVKKKEYARTAIKYALKLDKILKPKYCEYCKIECELQGHHTDYSKPLEVIWLCAKCHTALHHKLGGW